MKNTLKITFLLIFSIAIVSCKKDVKKVKENPETIGYSLDVNSAKIGWTAYKTTDKVAVSGEFTKVTIKNPKTSKITSELINRIKFSIPVSSIFSDNDERDPKIIKFFFGVMDSTEFLTGDISIVNDESGLLTIKMNGITNSFPITYTLSEKEFTLSGIMNLNAWSGQNAIKSLNKACFDLHQGEDGISKTWNDVQITGSINILKK